MRQMALVTILCFGHTTGSNQLRTILIASNSVPEPLRISNLRLGVLNPCNAINHDLTDSISADQSLIIDGLRRSASESFWL